MRIAGLRHTAAAVAVVVLAAVSAACDAAGSSNGGGSARSVDPTGVLRVGLPLPVAGVRFDVAKSRFPIEVQYMAPIFGTLMRQSDDGTISPWMAQNAQVVDAHTVRILLRPGMKFTDGSAYDAEAVRVSMLRSSRAEDPVIKANMDPGLGAVEDVQVVDPVTVVVTLSQPIAGQFFTELAQRAGVIVSPKQIAQNPEQINTNPVGAGPFTLVESTTQHISLRKNPGFWDAADMQLGGVDIKNTPLGPQQENGLLAGTLDWAAYVSVNSAKSIGDRGGFKTVVSGQASSEIGMCADKPPFDNEAVRQAIQFGVDRQRFSDLVYQGLAQPVHGFYVGTDTQISKTLDDAVRYDPQRARQILAAAGATNLTFDLHYSATQDFGPAAEALQSQLAGIGIKVNIVPNRDVYAEFINAKQPGAMLWAPLGLVGYTKFTKRMIPGNVATLCGADRSDVMRLVDQAVAYAPDDPRAIDLYRRAQDLIAERAYVIPIATWPVVAGWNESRVDGTPTFDALGYLHLDSVHIVKK